VAARFAPWVWYAVAVLALSGAILILIEPARPLTNPVFFLKLALIVAVALLMLAISWPLRRDELYWERSAARRMLGLSMAALSSLLWLGVICAGRWIAYTLSAT
jgi:putative copper export protein